MSDDRQANGVIIYKDSAGYYQERPIDPQVANFAATLATKADVSAIPQPATTTPRSEMTGGAVGAQPTRYAREDHQHPRLTSTTLATLGSNSQVTVPFTRTFTNKPGINLTEIDATASTQPLVLRAIGWTQDTDGRYTGVTVQGSRAQLLPELTPISSVLTLLTNLIGAVNTNILTPLTKYNIFGGSAAGASISVIAIARSDVPAT